MQANAIQMPLKDESVQCCAFSPPYWGLRKYEDLPTLVWDGIEGCEHEWGNNLLSKCNDSNRGTMTWTTGGDPAAKVLGEKSSQGQFCRLCNAWRGDLGLEPTPELYLDHMMLVMAECWRVLRNDGVCFVNIGDSYSGGGRGNYGNGLSLGQGPKHTKGHDFKYGNIKPKSLCLVPQKFAIRCQEAGWIIRSEIIWAKPNPMPESCKDRPTRSHEQVWMMVKQQRYYWDQEAVMEKSGSGVPGKRHQRPGIDVHGGNQQHGTIPTCPYRNARTVWSIATEPTPEAHFATWPSKLVNRMIRAATAQKACPHCRAPWERVVEKVEAPPEVFTKTKNPNDNFIAGHRKDGVFRGSGQKHQNWLNNNPSKTIGWQPTCSCPDNDGSGKCIVLDPFGGTCKTVLEAERLNRTGIGLDLSYMYLSEIAKPRQDVPLQRVLM